jgi:hypothetical protein
MRYRYIALPSPPKSHWADDAPLVRDLTVYEEEDKPQETGLLDARGTKLYRVREKIKMGFGS